MPWPRLRQPEETTEVGTLDIESLFLVIYGMDCPLVLIEWEDSARPIAEWHWLSDFADFNAVSCASVGWLIHDGEQVKALAPNMGDINTSGRVQASGVIRIPTRCVVRMTRLAETGEVISSASPVVLGLGASAVGRGVASELTRQELESGTA